MKGEGEGRGTQGGDWDPPPHTLGSHRAVPTRLVGSLRSLHHSLWAPPAAATAGFSYRNNRLTFADPSYVPAPQCPLLAGSCRSVPPAAPE